MIASALNSKEELHRIAFKELWKTIEKEYDNTPFNTKWNLFTELQSMKISNSYKNYSEIVKQFDEHRCCLLKADLLVNKLLSLLFLNIMPDTARHFKISNQVLKNGRKIPDYHYIKQKFNCFVNEELSYDLQEKMENNHLNMVTSRRGGRPHPSRVPSDWNNNSSNTELNHNNALNTLCNWCGSLNHKGNDCPHKDKICNYCKRKEHLQKVCFKKQYDDRVNGITTNEKDDSDHTLINTFITSEESHENQLIRHDSGRICLLWESHYASMIIIDSGVTCHAFYDRTMFESIKPTTQNTFVIDESPLSVQGQGNVHLHCKVNEKINKITFWNTLYTSGLKYHVISFKRINKSGFMIVLQKGISQLWKNDRI